MTYIMYLITSAFSSEVDWQCSIGIIFHVASCCDGTKSRIAGLIKAACGQLSADAISNGHTKIKILQNGHSLKSTHGLLNAAYGNAVVCPWKDANHRL